MLFRLAPSLRRRAPSLRRRAMGLAAPALAALALTGALCASAFPAAPSAGTPAPRPQVAMRAADFLETLGVNTHIGSDPYGDPARLAAMLAFIGVRHVRQTSPIGEAALAATAALGRSGARIDLVVNGGGPVDLPGAMVTVRQLAPFLAAVEGVNEAAIWPIRYRGRDGVEAAVALQKDLYAAVQAEPALARAAVYMFTLGGVDPGSFPAIGDLSAYADYANIHSYPPRGMRPCFVLHAAIDGGRTSAASRPVVITETGYYTLPEHREWGGVPEAQQASYVLGLLLDEAVAGVARTYLYDLIDDGPDPARREREHHFGLFRNDGTPKPAAEVLHNLTAVFADPGADRTSFRRAPIAFAATGVPYDYTGNTMLLQKSDGTDIVVLWNEQQRWNPDTQAEIPLQHYATALDLRHRYGTVAIVDPMLGTAPVQVLHDVSEIQLDLTDHPLLVVLPPGSRAPDTGSRDSRALDPPNGLTARSGGAVAATARAGAR